MINKIRAISHWQFWILFILKWSKFWRLFIMKLSKFHCEKGPKKECNHKIVIISRWIWFKILEISRQKQSKSCNEKVTTFFFKFGSHKLMIYHDWLGGFFTSRMQETASFCFNMLKIFGGDTPATHPCLKR